MEPSGLSRPCPPPRLLVHGAPRPCATLTYPSGTHRPRRCDPPHGGMHPAGGGGRGGHAVALHLHGHGQRLFFSPPRRRPRTRQLCGWAKIVMAGQNDSNVTENKHS
ncbi:hypothetical protein BS78_04G194700 [Paspalum vaginatum]|nr:hypothetical protein BS78_04G194700 [Paspalum vaginatum]KAJ1279952.1 hypothetical protein BS78_04G194700 [Paspalum vaginatum]